MSLSFVEKSLLVAAYYRGGRLSDQKWRSNSDQILTLSLFYTEDISFEDCARRFARKGYIDDLYDDDGELTESIANRYRDLIALLREHSELIEGAGDFESPAYPTFTSCRLTAEGLTFAHSLIPSFRQKPEFPDWPDAPAS